MADELAKNALNKDSITDIGLGLQEAYKLLWQDAFSKFQKSWEDNKETKVSFYKTLNPKTKKTQTKTYSKIRRDDVNIFRLTSGYNILNEPTANIFNNVNPNCSHCNTPENTAHYLLHCSKYSNQRKNLIYDLEKLKLKLSLTTLLKDPVCLPYTIKYINATKRFTR